MGQMHRSFAQRGNYIEVSTTVDKEKLDSKTVLETINNFRTQLADADNKILQAQNQVKQIEDGKEQTQKMLKDLCKFEEWAKERQELVSRAAIKEAFEELKDVVGNEVTTDNTLTEEENAKQKFFQLQNKVARHKRVAEEVSQHMMQKYIFESPIFENPY